MKAGCSVGASICAGFHDRTLGGGLLYWGTQKMRFLRQRQNALYVGHPLHRGPVGESGGVCLPGLLREKKSVSGFHSWTQRTLRYVW
jgi:hypothetical protein